MPSFWTHYAFAKECEANLPCGALRNAVARHPHAYYTGMQGPDMFLFYLPALLRKKRLSTELHTKFPDRLLVCLWRQAAKAKGDDRSIALAYAAGLLGHYCLDSETHPFVYAFSGIKHSAECFCVHNALEADLNGLTVKRVFGKDPTQLPLPDVYDLPEKEERCIAALLSRAIRCVYKLDCSPATVSHARFAVRTACHLLSDLKGRKAKFFRALEKPLRLPYLSPLFLGISRYYSDPANFAHRMWRDPYTGATGNADFFMLYDSAKEKYAEAIGTLSALSADAYPAFFSTLCKCDFHGEPNRTK